MVGGVWAFVWPQGTGCVCSRPLTAPLGCWNADQHTLPVVLVILRVLILYGGPGVDVVACSLKLVACVVMRTTFAFVGYSC